MEEKEKRRTVPKERMHECVESGDSLPVKKRNFFVCHKKSVILIGILFAIGLATGIAAIADGVNGIKALGDFITEQILGMKWLNMLLGAAFTGMFGEQFMATRWGGAIQFFIYDTIKIMVLLCLLIFLISYIQSYFPPERTKKILGKFHGIGANVLGALLGTVTPFCSCSSIPIFMGFTRAGISCGVTFSFLISSPLVDLGGVYSACKRIRVPHCHRLRCGGFNPCSCRRHDN